MRHPETSPSRGPGAAGPRPLPQDAPWVALREVVEARTGTLNPRAWPDDPFTYVDVTAVDNKLKTVTGARKLPGAEAPSRARKLIRTGDVLVSTVRPNLNAVALVPESLDGEVASTAFCVLRATARVLPEYLYFFVRSRTFLEGLRRLVKGALYPAVSESVILDRKLPLPDIDAQRRIADILLCAQRGVQLRRDIQANSMRMDSAVYFDVFGDSLTNPKGWPIAELGSVLAGTPQNGLYKPQTDYGSGTPIVRIDSFRDGELRDPAFIKRVRLDEAELRRYALAEGDIVVNRVNSPELVGKNLYVPALPEPTVFESNMMRLRIDTGKALPRYVIAALQTTRTRHHFLVNTKRAISQASLNQQDLKSLTLMLPPLEKQAAFARYADASAASMDRQRQLLKATEATLAGLLEHFFRPAG